jgi:alanyl aminopeptidase
LKRLGFSARKGESPSDRRLRSGALALLARSGHPEVVRELVRLGLAYAGLSDGRFHPEAVDPDLAGLVLGVAVEHGDRALFDALRGRLASTDDASLRRRILGALGQARDAERSALALALSLDPELRRQEGMTTLFVQSMDHRTRAAAWRFLQDHFDAVVAKVPETYAASLPYLASFCEPEGAAEAGAFFEPRAGAINGLTKVLRQVREGIGLCAAQVAAQRESAQRFFATRAGRKLTGPRGR